MIFVQNLQNWPVCKAQCNNQVVIDKVPTPETKLMLWEDHPDMVGVLDSLFWEDQKVWYKCIDEKNEGIILSAAKPGQVQVEIMSSKDPVDKTPR